MKLFNGMKQSYIKKRRGSCENENRDALTLPVQPTAVSRCLIGQLELELVAVISDQRRR